MNKSTIFKTFDSKIDKWTSKIGIFGKSFNELGTAVNNAFESVFDAAINNSEKNVGFWESLKNNLFSTKEDKDWIKNSLGEIISQDNIDSYIKQLDLDFAKEKLAGIFNYETLVKQNKKSWQDYFDTLDDSENYLVNLIKNTDDLSKLEGKDLVDACNNAREAALNHNLELQNMSFSAKAGKVALKGLVMAGNMLATWAVSKAIELVVQKFDDWIHRAENAKKAADEMASALKSANDSLKSQKNLITRVEESYEKLSNGVDSLGNNVSLSKDDFADYQDICNQIAEYYPQMVSAWTKEGNAVVDLKEKVDELKTAYEEERIAALNSFVASADKIVDSYNLNADYSSSSGYDRTSGYKQKIAALQAYRDALLEDSTIIFDLLENGGDGFSKYDLQNALKEEASIGDYTMEQLPDHLNSVIKNLQTKLSQEDDSMKQMLINMFALDSSDYKTLSDEAYQIGTSLINSLESDFFDNKNAGDYREFVDDLLKQFTSENEDKINSSFSSLLNLDNEKDNLSVSEYKERINKIISDLQTYLDLDENIVELMVNAQISDDTSLQSTDILINNVKEKLQDDFDNKVGELTLEELQIAAEQIEVSNDTLLTWEELKQKIQEAKGETTIAALANKDYAGSFKTIKEATNEVLNNKKLFDEAIEKTKNGEYLDYDTVSNLIELDPSLANEFVKTADGYKIGIDALIAANEKYVQSKGAESLKSKIEETNTDIANAQAKINSLSEEKARLEAEILANEDNDQYNRDDAYKRISEIDEQINGFTNSVTEGKNAIAAYNLILGEIGEKASTIKTMFSSDISSSYELLNSTIEDFNSNGIINLSTLEKIKDAYPELKGVVDQYLRGVINENELIAKLTESYEQDENGYYQYLLAKLGYNEDYVNAAFNGDDGIVEYFAKNYEIDLTNFRDYISRKKAVQATFDSYVAGGISEWWTEAGGWTEKFLNLDDRQKHGISDIVSQYQNALEELEGFEDPDSKFQKELAGIREKTQNSLKADKESSTSSSAEETKKTFDWIERAIEKVQKAFGKLGDAARSVYKTFTVRNKGLYSEIDLINKEIKLQEKAYTQYMKKAASVGISSDLANKVQNGAIDISEYDSSTAEIIEEYKEWYENAPLYSNVWRYSI